MAWWDWPVQDGGDPSHIVVCVHGLSRQGRDFDALASLLSRHARVVSVDVAGRGESDWLADPMGYQVETYARDMALLLTHLRQQVPGAVIDWVGTSMGGLIGIAVASQAALAPRKLVLNDVGPVVQWSSLQRIGAYVGTNRSFGVEQEAFDYMASISEGFGPHTPDEWARLSRPMLRQRDGRWWFHYDPAIGTPIKALLAQPEDVALAVTRQGEEKLWSLYDAISSETLLLRGAESDLLAPETAMEMARRGPKARCVEFAGVGHAPTLVADDQKKVVLDFLCGS
ncbi:alpha/beta hydrolase [Hydrogenophaga sp. 5NK40-0174]|uniref:alpha/beta fold hydrolase n=1 Tax=Hydrogenophaga sp. 5NK40-0174 TaxID=3127649 RepID=UPI003342B52F